MAVVYPMRVHDIEWEFDVVVEPPDNSATKYIGVAAVTENTDDICDPKVVLLLFIRFILYLSN